LALISPTLFSHRTPSDREKRERTKIKLEQSFSPLPVREGAGEGQG
jgi:hypothetical protein